MRAFIVMCLVAAACADKLGYNYQPVGHSDAGLSFAPGSGVGGSLSGATLGGSIGGLSGGSLGGGLGGVGGGFDGGLAGLGGSLGGLSGGSLGGFGGGLSSGSLGGYGGGLSGGSLGGLGGGLSGGSLGGLGGGLSGGSLGAPVSYQAPAPQGELEKEFYTFSANDAEFDQPQDLERVANSVNKGLRVIFIKGPENHGIENAALALAKESAQQQTAIYVLNKQADIGDLANKLNSLGSNRNSKPEVHFVKYRTPEDAANAQQQIQSQYDSLGGSSHSHNGGVAPVLNFASQAPVAQVQAQAPGNSYLPSSIFRNRA